MLHLIVSLIPLQSFEALKLPNRTRSIWKMLGPFATASRRTPIHQVSLLSHTSTVARHLRIDVHDDDNAWQRGPLWPHRMGPMIDTQTVNIKLDTYAV